MKSLLIPALLLLAACSREEKKAQSEAKPPEPISVQTAQAQTRMLDRKLAVTGSLVPDETVSVGAEVQGRVTAIHVDFGQNVRKGQVLAELDPQELKLAVDRSKASLAQALARLGLDPSQENFNPETTPAIRQAQAQLEDARSKFDSTSRLIKTGDVSQERYNEAQRQFEARRALFEASKDDARTIAAQAQALKAELQLAQKRLGDATVRAPFDGSVAEKLVSPGQYLRENAPILTIVKPYPMRLRLEVPEAAAGAVRIGSTLTFHTDAASGSEFNAVVRQLNPSLDPKSRTLMAEARIAGADQRLRPGMFVQVQLVLSKANESVLVPKQALYNVAGLTKVFVVQNGRAVEKRILPGDEIDGWVEVPRDSVAPGDEVAISALMQLVQGAPVKATPKGSGLKGSA